MKKNTLHMIASFASIQVLGLMMNEAGKANDTGAMVLLLLSLIVAICYFWYTFFIFVKAFSVNTDALKTGSAKLLQVLALVFCLIVAYATGILAIAAGLLAIYGAYILIVNLVKGSAK